MTPDLALALLLLAYVVDGALRLARHLGWAVTL